MLEITDLHVRYQRTHAVDGLTLSVPGAGAICLLGPNGAGKSSTLAAISGLVPYEGSIRFAGEDLANASPTDIARRGLVHVPEGRHVFPTLTVHDNLLMGRVAANGRPPLYGLDDIYDLLPALRRLRKRSGFALSGGEQQMLVVGRALMAAPRLLMLDEPSLGLAPAVAHDIFRALAQIAATVPVLVVEQNTSEALDLCDAGHVLVAGRLVLTAATADLRDRRALLASYLGQADAVTAGSPAGPSGDPAG